jgi:type I restriction enzyme S subunit
VTDAGWASSTRFALAPLARIAEVRLGKMLQPAAAADGDRLTPYLRAGSLATLDAIDELPAMFASALDVARYEVRHGDLIVAEGGDCGQTGYVPDVPSPTIIQNSLHRIRSNHADVRFIRYCLDAVYASGWLEVACNKSTFGHLTQEKLGAMRIPLPNGGSQHAIADYLDRETARIDGLVTAKRRMLELLEERGRVAISDVTAAGRPMTVRRVISLCTTGPRGWGEHVADEGEPFIRSANLRRDDIELQTSNLALVTPPASREAARSRTFPGDVLVGVTGANTGWVGIVRPYVGRAYVSQHVAILRPIRSLLSEWLAYSLFSIRVQDQLIGGQYGGTKQQLGLQDLAEIVIRVPDVIRQREFVAVLERAKRISRAAFASLTAQIRLLEEHRQALITAAVTGQLGISEAA